MRVVSLLPSATEMLYALGVEPVGVSHECDHPPAAAELPSVIDTRIDPDVSSVEINEQVAAAVDDGGVYEIDRELLAALEPDVIVSQGICDVCAVDDSRIRQTVSALGLDTTVIASDPHSLGDVLTDLERLGRLLGREERAAAVVRELEAQVERIEHATPADGPRVAVLDWLDPPMVAGHWIPDMVDRSGGEYGLAAPGERSRPRQWEEIRAYDPEVLVCAPCGFELDQTLEHVTELTDREGWASLSAVRTGRAFAMDGHHYVNRPGPRLVETLELLASVVHPDHITTPLAEEAVSPLASSVAADR